ncbi:hypothetical protein [Enterococcus camelliae]|uniref:Uncharacterized protein n=1 Tax=Enterococcus camelliae TaxID=453959 RepID=A0ABW5TMI3_9ENTE
MAEGSPILDSLAMNQHLKKIQEGYSQKSQWMKNEQIQTFVFDLRDYIEAVNMLVDIIPKEQAEQLKSSVEPLENTTISYLLANQNKSLRLVLQQLQEQATDTGEARRFRAGLQGVIELNQLMLQDTKRFEQEIANESLKNEEQQVEKKHLLQRIFGKK